jgi:hypothetical protein
MKTAETIEAANSLKAESRGRDGKRVGKRGKSPNSIKNLKPYVPGQSGNPGGQPGYDVAAALARAVIEGSQEAAYEGFSKQLANGNAYAFKELAERGYGPKPQQHQITGADGGPIQTSIQVSFILPNGNAGS